MKKIISVFTAFVMMFSLFSFFTFAADDNDVEFQPPAEVGDVTEGDFQYKLYSDLTATVTSYTGSDIAVSVPSEINGYTVTALAELWVGSDCSAKDLYIPATVTNIGETETSNLGSMYNCKALQNIYVDEGNTAYCSVDGVLFTKDMQRIAVYPSGNPRKSYTIPQGVEIIGEAAFWFSENLTNLELPETIVKIEPDGVRGCKGLTQIKLPESLRILEGNAFMACEKLKSIEIPEGITVIPFGCFWSCYALESVHLPSTVTEIGHYAFAACYPLTEIIFPEGLLKMGGMCFALCSKLTSVTLPKSLESVKSSVFQDSGVKTIYGYTGSLAETIANVKGFEFIPLDKPEPLLGDVNFDGIIDADDYAILIDYVMCIQALTQEQFSASDLNNDGAVDGFDAIYLDLIINNAI